MGYWGEKIFQSDTALDLIDEITDDAGLELYMFDDDTAVTIARDALNAGILATLVAKYTADPPDMWDDPNHKIFMLVALAMQTGAIVSKELRTVVRTLIRRIATPEQAKKQMRTALRVSTLREPYNFDSPGLVETAMMRMQ
ncbi:hypothetical protein MMC11_000668 [Xylographa trunciseda]|nr:hypothetical protein [Xylographa trunciseda]